MILLSLDLEMAQPSGKIIQVGACIGDTNSGQILDTFSMFVNPEERLSDYIKNLTGITQEDVDNGHTLQHVYSKLKTFHSRYGAFCNICQWGSGDAELLKAQLGNPEDWPFGRREIDAKTLMVSYRIANSMSMQGGLAKSMTKFGMNFAGRKHNALDDSINTFRIYCKLLEFFKKQ